MGNEIESIFGLIKSKLTLFLGENNIQLNVDKNHGYLYIKANLKVLDGSYYEEVSSNLILLSLEEAKQFLIDLDSAIIISSVLGEDSISLKSTDNRMVFAMNNERVSSSDIASLFSTLENQALKSTLPLELDIIKLRSLCGRYKDLLEQVNEKQKFLQSYNELITSFDGKRKAIKFANKVYPVKEIGWGEVVDIDISEGEDIVDSIVNGSTFYFLTTVSLEKRNAYLENLNNYETRIRNLVQRLEIEYQKLSNYDSIISMLLSKISKSKISELETLDEIPKYDCVSLDTILTEEKDKYERGLEERKKESPRLKNPYPFIEDLDGQQRINLTLDDRRALMLYKSFLYHLFNQIISYVRSNNIDYDVLNKDEYVRSLILEEYNKYKEKCNNNQMECSIRHGVYTFADELISEKGKTDEYYFFYLVFKFVPFLEKALSKVRLNQPLTVYRCVYEKENADIYSGDLGNALLSTTVSTKVVSDFLNDRKPDINFKAQKVIYKINLPVGSPVVAYTDFVFFPSWYEENCFGDGQKEILLDSALYDFTYVKCDYNRLKDGSLLHTVTLNAVPKYKMGEVKTL